VTQIVLPLCLTFIMVLSPVSHIHSRQTIETLGLKPFTTFIQENCQTFDEAGSWSGGNVYNNV